MSGRHAREEAAAGDGIRFVTRGIGHEEAAAVTAVLGEALQQSENAHRSPEQGPDAWARSARGLRSPIAPGPGAWRGFTG